MNLRGGVVIDPILVNAIVIRDHDAREEADHDVNAEADVDANFEVEEVGVSLSLDSLLKIIANSRDE